MTDPFVHLRVASGYSLRYGASHPSSLVERAAEYDMDTLALTDRDGLYGAVRFAKACMRAGIAPILGVDLAVPFAQVREQGLDLVVHDPLCPLTPVEFLLEAIALSRSTGAVVVGVRPVTDTVKQYDAPPDGPLRLGATVDRGGSVGLGDDLVVREPAPQP